MEGILSMGNFDFSPSGNNLRNESLPLENSDQL
jgi:hypothetical protein